MSVPSSGGGEGVLGADEDDLGGVAGVFGGGDSGCWRTAVTISFSGALILTYLDHLTIL